MPCRRFVVLLATLAFAATIHAQSSLDLSTVDERTLQSIAVLAEARQQRIRAALPALRRSESTLLGAQKESWDSQVDAGINWLGEERAIEEIPLLLKNFGYTGISGGRPTDPFSTLIAAGALAKIGPRAIPGLMEKVKTCESGTWVAGRLPVYIGKGVGRHKISTHLLILLTLYSAAGDRDVIDLELKDELTRLLAEKSPSAETSKHIENLNLVMEEAKRLHEDEQDWRRIEEQNERRFVEEMRKRKPDEELRRILEEVRKRKNPPVGARQ